MKVAAGRLWKYFGCINSAVHAPGGQHGDHRERLAGLGKSVLAGAAA